MNPLTVTRFGMVEPGECAPSDHAGILMEYAIEDASIAPPAVVITAPAQNATVAGHVWISAQVTDPRGVRRLEWLLDGRVLAVQTASPFVFDWNVTEWPNGAHQLQAAAQFLERTAYMAHQGLALGTQPHVPAVPLEQAGPERLLQLADRVADRTRRQVDLGSGASERAGAAGGLERTQDREGDLVQHA